MKIKLLILFIFVFVIIINSQTKLGIYFPKDNYNYAALPTYEKIKDKLPIPILSDDKNFLEMYWFCWETAFNKLKKPEPGSPFVSNFIDEAFSPNIFQWDTHFMILFWKYAFNIFPAIESHDNFYASQWEDGYICREIVESNGQPFYYMGKENTINPPLFAWVEYEYYLISGDNSRFRLVIPPIERYLNWIERNRKKETRHNLFWQTNLGSGMDNSPRSGSGWTDISAQMALSYKYLAKMSEAIGQNEKAKYFKKKGKGISDLITKYMWNDEVGLYFDVDDSGRQVPVKTSACFWPMLTDIPTKEQRKKLLNNLKDSTEFWTHIPFPTLAKDEKQFEPKGDYWHGSVWAPTNYMIIKGIENSKDYSFAYEASYRYLKGMQNVFDSTGTVWENYSSEFDKPGSIAKPDFVGWTGLGPIALLIENIIGIKINVPENLIVWHLMRDDEFGIKNLSFGQNNISLVAEKSGQNKFKISVMALKDFNISLIKGETETFYEIKPGSSEIEFIY